MTVTALSTALFELPEQECEDCKSVGEPCGYHRGFGDGWDAASAAVERNRG